MLDQCGNTLNICSIPNRIVCLVPSLTEFLCEIGLEKNIVGITKFCIHPKHLRQNIEVIGGTKNLHLEKIEALNPTLIIANKEENIKEQIEYLQSKFPVYVSDINSVEDTIAFIADMALIFEKQEECQALLSKIQEVFFNSREPLKWAGKSVLYLIWKDPYMAVASNTFIHDIIERLELKNVLNKSVSRYPELNKEEISNLNADYIFLSSEPYPFQEKHIEELSQISPKSKIVLVDGELFSWYGVRFLKIKEYVNSLLIIN